MQLGRAHAATVVSLATAASLLMGLISVGYPHRCAVDPAACANDSDYVEARGFPVAWLVTAPLADLDLPVHRRILSSALGVSLIALCALATSNWLALLGANSLSRRVPPPASSLIRWVLPALFLVSQLGIGLKLYFPASDLTVNVVAFAVAALAYSRGAAA